jgi:hypothetical protein
MTRKDYVALAQALQGQNDTTTDPHQHVRVCLAIAKALEQDNPNFDRVRFLNACGWRELTGIDYK